MGQFTVVTTPEQDAAIDELARLRAKALGKPLETPATLIQQWAVHPITASLEAARDATERAATERRALLIASDDPVIRARAEALEAELAQLAEEARSKAR